MASRVRSTRWGPVIPSVGDHQANHGGRPAGALHGRPPESGSRGQSPPGLVALALAIGSALDPRLQRLPHLGADPEMRDPAILGHRGGRVRVAAGLFMVIGLALEHPVAGLQVDDRADDVLAGQVISRGDIRRDRHGIGGADERRVEVAALLRRGSHRISPCRPPVASGSGPSWMPRPDRAAASPRVRRCSAPHSRGPRPQLRGRRCRGHPDH